MTALIVVVAILGVLVALLLTLVVLLHTRRYCAAIDALAKGDAMRGFDEEQQRGSRRLTGSPPRRHHALPRDR